MKGNARILVLNNLKEAAEHITAIGAEEGKVDWLASKSGIPGKLIYQLDDPLIE